MALSDTILQQVINSVVADPSKLTSLVEHPYSTVGNITNNSNVSKEEASQVVAAVTQLAGGQTVDLDKISSQASQLLGQSNNSVHSMASSILGGLLGGGTQQVQPAQQAASVPDLLSAIDPDMLSAIIGNLGGVSFSGNTVSNKQAVDLSDGFGLDDLMGLAGILFGK